MARIIEKDSELHKLHLSLLKPKAEVEKQPESDPKAAKMPERKSTDK